MQSGVNNQRKRKVASTPKSASSISQTGVSKAGGSTNFIKKRVGVGGGTLNPKKPADSGADLANYKT